MTDGQLLSVLLLLNRQLENAEPRIVNDCTEEKTTTWISHLSREITDQASILQVLTGLALTIQVKSRRYETLMS